ncbi:MAG: hypothetical protein ACE14M_11000 [Terriglobales bacterium]
MAAPTPAPLPSSELQPSLQTPDAQPTQTQQPQVQGVQARQITLVDLIGVLSQNADPVIKLLTATAEKYQNGKEREVRLKINMAWFAIGVVIVIVGVAGFLTYKSKIDGSTFTFLLGLIVGYVLTFVRDQITGPGEK